MKLIINADDFGLSEANTLGIIKAHKDGILTSTTMMTNMEYAELAGKLMKDYPKLSVGLHLCLTMGEPILKTHKTIVDESGNFRKQSEYYNQSFEIEYQEIVDEYQAQMERFIYLTGKKPSHIDHHHSQCLTPKIPEIFLDLAKRYHVPIRNGYEIFGDAYHFRRVDFERGFYGEGVDLTFFTEDKSNLLKQDIIECMSHPGYLDYDLYNKSSYNIDRMKELDILTSKEVKEWVKENNIELINFNTIKLGE